MIRNALNLLTFNVGSLVGVSRRVDLLNSLRINRVDIAFIQETHLRSRHRVSFDEYNCIQDKSSQGVAIVLRKSYKYSRLFLSELEFPNVLISIEFLMDGVVKKFLFGSVYIPVNCQARILNNGLQRLGDFAQGFDGTFIGGDFNSRHSSWGDSAHNANGNIFFNFLQTNPLYFVRICDSMPTFPNGTSFLDHFLISPNCIDSFNQSFEISSLSSFSDHFPLKLRIQIRDFEIILRPPLNFISFKNTNWDNFKNDVTLSIIDQFPDSNRNLSNSEIDRYAEEFSSIINTITNNHSEKVEIKNKKYLVSDGVQRLYKIKYQWQKDLRRIFRRTLNRHNSDYLLLSKQIQLLNIMIKRQVELEQSELFNTKLRNIKPGPSAHRQIYKIIGYKKNRFISELSVDGITVESDALKLEKLKDHFGRIYNSSTLIEDEPHIVNVINNTISTIPDVQYSFNDRFQAYNSENCLGLVSVDEVIILSKDINNKKSAGLDKVSNFIIRKLPAKAFEYLAIIFNNCLNNSYYPKPWKVSKIVPIQK